MKEITTPAGRMNFYFGILFLVLLLVGYTSTWMDYLFAAFVTTIRHTNAEVPAMPWFAGPAFLVYAVFCVVYVDLRTEH